ncbi:MAG: hypothetical protein ABEJ43_05115 [Haloferacaceae archaeon]
MRRIIRRFAVALGLLVAGLLALGAAPAALGSGEPYHLVVSETDASGPAANVSGLSERRYPYLTEALAAPDGRSSGYRRGRFGLKESFTHSPFDEVAALAAQNRDAVVETTAGDRAVRVRVDGERYRVEVRR